MPEEEKITLAVSGGGYRATLYALGAIWRLNEFGMLPRLKTITSVSGGSITTAWLAYQWDELEFDDSVATNFEEIIAEPIEKLCKKGIDVKAGFSGLFSFRDSIGDKLAKAYDRHLFNGAKIASLSNDAPEFVFYGTNYQTGSGLQITKDFIHDYKIGDYPNPNIKLAKVVAISSAFPPVLSPVHVETEPQKWVKGKYAKHFDKVALKKKLVLTDGGLYDNMGLEKVWKGKGEYTHVLVCDAGAPFKVTPEVKTNWAGQLMRMTDVMTDQQRALRKRALISNFKDIDKNGMHRKYDGTYFGISTKITNYKLEDSMVSDNKITGDLKKIRTRLNPFSEQEQGYLVNWGYALTDSAIRKHVSNLPMPNLLKMGTWPRAKYALDTPE